MICEQHPQLQKKIDKMDTMQDSISVDIGIIKSYLVGNGREGIIKKVDRHDKYLYMFAGGSALVGTVFAGVKLFL